MCYDFDTLAMSFKSLEDHIGLQVALQTKYLKKLNKGRLVPSELKRLMRVGFPDAYKREFILNYYQIDMNKCAYDYATRRKGLSDAMLELYADQLETVVSNLQYDYLTEVGKQELKTMLALFVQH